ncbi:hypothetical protein LCGC14_1275620 [marine sediment metagenome]|uniref:Uncharacterized protein n=1 Tax=marine sediment metagenome TaxID=412755 RepID=A0A0F9KWT7_9ZZZZ
MPDDYIPYKLTNPQLNMAVPPNEVRPGSFSYLSGVDGRYRGCLRKFYGMKEVVDFDDVSGLGDIDAYAGVSYFKPVTFMKRGTSTVFRGFVIRWDSQNDTTNQQIDLVYTDDDGSTWTRQAIWAAGNSITGSLAIDCASAGEYLLVAVDTKSTKTVYWAAAMTTVDSGPGAFVSALAALTENTQATSASHYLKGNGTYRVAWRFYDATRGIYSALSNELTIFMNLYKTTKATGVISFDSSADDSGLFVDGDIITINGRTYEADDDSSETSDVSFDITGLTTIAQHAAAFAAAVNGDGSAVVVAAVGSASVTLTAITAGSAANAYGLSVAEAAPNQVDISVSGSTLSGGGQDTDDPEEQCKNTLDFAAHGSVLATYDFDDFDALFDTVQVFRSIDIGNTATNQDGAILYLEQEIAKTGNWATSGVWDSLQAVVGTLLDEALVFQDAYDPQKDIVKALPASGTVARYEDVTFMAEAADEAGSNFDIIHSSMQHLSPEYFTTYNARKGSAEEGRAVRILSAGDSALSLHENAIIHIFKPSRYKAIQFTPIHKNRGLASKGGAHAVGNSVVMVTGVGLVIVSAADGNMGQVSSSNRLFYDTWNSDFSVIESSYDAKLDASFILDPNRSEILVIWHSSKLLSLLEGVNFVSTGETNAIDGTDKVRAYFVTATGLVVTPDYDESGSGTAWGLSDSYTLNGTATSAGNSLVDSSATFHADMVGALCYMTSGDSAGEVREIDTVNVGTKTLTFTSNFSNSIASGDTYAINPIPFKVRLWPLQIQQMSRFSRWVMTSISLKCRNLSSNFGGGTNTNWRCGVYRNSGSSIEASTVAVAVDTNPADSVGALNVDGVDIEPYIEQIAAGVSFELTGVEIGVSIVDSREVTA